MNTYHISYNIKINLIIQNTICIEVGNDSRRPQHPHQGAMRPLSRFSVRKKCSQKEHLIVFQRRKRSRLLKKNDFVWRLAEKGLPLQRFSETKAYFLQTKLLER